MYTTLPQVVLIRQRDYPAILIPFLTWLFVHLKFGSSYPIFITSVFIPSKLLLADGMFEIKNETEP